LPAASYEVVRAVGSGEAITLAQQLKPDLILLDPALTHAESSEVVGVLQGDGTAALIPIVVMTGEQGSLPATNTPNLALSGLHLAPAGTEATWHKS
jgi:CheY-like chemotaxis protein